MGGKLETFTGLTGIGDLIVTCASVHSRNRRAGYLMGQGKTMQEAMDEVQMVVEGVYSAKAARKLAEKYEVSMPIVEQINEVLFENKSAAQAVDELMLRESKVSIPCCRGRMRQYSFFNSREQSRNNPLCFCIDWYQQNKGVFLWMHFRYTRI